MKCSYECLQLPFPPPWPPFPPHYLVLHHHLFPTSSSIPIAPTIHYCRIAVYYVFDATIFTCYVYLVKFWKRSKHLLPLRFWLAVPPVMTVGISSLTVSTVLFCSGRPVARFTNFQQNSYYNWTAWQTDSKCENMHWYMGTNLPQKGMMMYNIHDEYNWHKYHFSTLHPPQILYD